MLFNLKTQVRRYLARMFKVHRPASYPFISGDGFRAISNFVYDQFLDFNPADVSKGDTVFVRTNNLADFFENVHPKITKPYVLVSHNEDSTVGPEFSSKIDEKILHWYAENLNFKHPQVTLLPIGIQNFVVGKEEDFIHIFRETPPQTENKTDRILFGFTVGKIEERKSLFEILSNSPLADEVSKPRREYYKALSTYKFIASPRGGGLDCHRTWEAYFYKVIPVLLRSPFSEQIEELGFPVLLVNDWSEVSKFEASMLANHYEMHKNKFDNPKLYLPYWFEQFAKHNS